MKRKKLMMRMALWLKTLALGVVLPSAVLLALFTAWKGITISLMALMLAGIVGLKGLVASDQLKNKRMVQQSKSSTTVGLAFLHISQQAYAYLRLVSAASRSSSASSSSSIPHHVVLSGLPSHHQHYWKRLDVAGDTTDWDSSSHHLAYRAYV
ncbi:hypothetical protein J6590_000832 [Homalodisca vitripennis]|nr:hypothetical protein J6590_000832 [Homalodisca vitripennis]